MKPCKQYEILIKKLIADEISSGDKKYLLEHTENCPACREILELHQQLAKAAPALPQAETADFLNMRRNVLRAIRSRQEIKKYPWYYTLTEHWKSAFNRPAPAYAFSFAMLIFGIYLGNTIINPGVESDTDLIQQISYTAQQNKGLSEVKNSPYVFSNVKLQEINTKNISLSFDVTTHLDLVRPKDDPMLKEILAQSMLNPQPVSSRLKTISYSEKFIDPKIKEALIFTLMNDNTPAVRLKAMGSLVKYRNDRQIQDALLKILKEDDSVQMRLMAIDFLTDHKIDGMVLEKELGGMESGKNTAVMLKVNQYLQKNK